MPMYVVDRSIALALLVSGWNCSGPRVAISSYTCQRWSTASCAAAASRSASAGLVRPSERYRSSLFGVLRERDARTGRVEQERVSAAVAHDRVVADQRPVPARRGTVLLVEPLLHVDPVGDAVAVGDHERRPVERLGLAQRKQRLALVGTHRDPRHVHAAVRDRLERQVLLGHVLPGRRELRHRSERRRLRHLAARVRVDLGVEHQHVDVEAACQHVVEPAASDVVRPAVAPDDPDAAPDEVVDDAPQVVGRRPGDAVEPALQLVDPAALRAELGLGHLRQPRGSRPPDRRRPGRRGGPRAARGPGAHARRPSGGSRARTRRCPRTASSTRPARGRRCSASTASSAGCRRRSTSTRSRSRSSAGRRTAETAASGTASRRSRRTLPRTRTAAAGTARRVRWRSRPGRGR